MRLRVFLVLMLASLVKTRRKFVIGGEFNVTLQPSLDCSGGNTTLRELVKFL